MISPFIIKNSFNIIQNMCSSFFWLVFFCAWLCDFIVVGFFWCVYVCLCVAGGFCFCFFVFFVWCFVFLKPRSTYNYRTEEI